MRAKLLAIALMLVFAFALMVQLMPTASASEEAATEHETPGSENGLVVAVGGAIAVYGFLSVILFMTLRKRKKKAQPKA